MTRSLTLLLALSSDPLTMAIGPTSLVEPPPSCSAVFGFSSPLGGLGDGC